jgi:hypothetical protein
MIVKKNAKVTMTLESQTKNFIIYIFIISRTLFLFQHIIIYNIYKGSKPCKYESDS